MSRSSPTREAQSELRFIIIRIVQDYEATPTLDLNDVRICINNNRVSALFIKKRAENNNICPNKIHRTYN